MKLLEGIRNRAVPIFSPRRKHSLKPARDRSDRATKVTMRLHSGSRQARGKQDHRCVPRALLVEGLGCQNTVPATVCVCYESLERLIGISHKHWNHGKIMGDKSAIIPLDIRNGVILTLKG